jgi:hypothetical protein
MSEDHFQRALIHLYSNIDRLPSYSDALFDDFALTDAERHALKELMCGQRQGLLTFNQLLHHKRSRSISQSLPYSSRLVPEQLDALVQAFACRPFPEGATDFTAALRSFAEYVGAEIADRRQLSKASELVWFEAMCASADRATLLRCRFDVPAALQDPSLFDTPEPPHHPCWFVVFPADGRLKVVAVGAGLASAIARLQSGRSVADALASLPDDAQRIALAESLQQLQSMDVRFASDRTEVP